jgi:kanamycin kinase
MPAGPPSRGIEAPAVVRKLAAGYPTRAVWENEGGGITFEVKGPDHVVGSGGPE